LKKNSKEQKMQRFPEKSRKETVGKTKHEHKHYPSNFMAVIKEVPDGVHPFTSRGGVQKRRQEPPILFRGGMVSKKPIPKSPFPRGGRKGQKSRLAAPSEKLKRGSPAGEVYFGVRKIE